MAANIHIPAEEVWSFFQKNKDRLSEEMVSIAENGDTEYAVYLTEDNGYPLFSVCKGKEDPEYEEGAISEKDCTETAKKCFVKYLFPVTVRNEKVYPWKEDEEDGEPEEQESFTQQEMEDNMYEREDELSLALCDFLQVVLREGRDGTDIMDEYGTEFVDEILDYILEYLGFEHMMQIYRPMFITDDETQCEIYTEYPYGDYDGLSDDTPLDTGGGWE